MFDHLYFHNTWPNLAGNFGSRYMMKFGKEYASNWILLFLISNIFQRNGCHCVCLPLY